MNDDLSLKAFDILAMSLSSSSGHVLFGLDMQKT